MITASVIIPVQNCASELTGLLSDLKQQSSCNFEVVFVDNHSCDQTPQQIRAFQRLSGIPVQIIDVQRHRNSWSSFAVGLTYAVGRSIIFLPSRARLAPNYLETLTKDPAPIVALYNQTQTYEDTTSLIAAFLRHETPQSVIGMLIDRQLFDGFSFELQLGSLLDKRLLYHVLSQTTTASFIQSTPLLFIAEPAIIPQYQETHDYLRLLSAELGHASTDLVPLLWHHFHLELTLVYQQIRRLPFNTRQLYSEELRSLKYELRELEQQKLAFSQSYRLMAWLNRRFARQVKSLTVGPMLIK